MVLGGLFALGIDRAELVSSIEGLNLADFDIEVSKVNRAGISAVHVRTKYPEEHVHRHLSDIEEIIDSSRLSGSVKERSKEIFTNLAIAEAKVHGIDVSKVHFHEVGAMDAIIDVVGACIGFEMLGIEGFACSSIHVGSGFVNIAHGKYPVPPPAVVELLTKIPIYSTEIEGELITPTGAAIISTLCKESGEIPEMKVEKTGYGAGSREYEKFPNVLRMMVGVQKSKSEVQSPESEKLILLETNLDDVSAEILGFVMDKAFEIGALDCWFTPIQMKKNRPATSISILCDGETKPKLSELLFSETTTLGVRISEIRRECLPREMRKIETEFGMTEIKIARYQGKIVNVKPEFEWLRTVAVKKGLSIEEVRRRILANFEFESEEK